MGETDGLIECERWGLGGGAISNATRLLSRANARVPRLDVTIGKGGHSFCIESVKTRPLKEAMVTVGGVDLSELSAATMESTRTPGLYFAGEVIDVDGPTGGYNLTAAFAMGRLAVNTIADTRGLTIRAEKPGGEKKRHSRRQSRPANRQQRRRKN